MEMKDSSRYSSDGYYKMCIIVLFVAVDIIILYHSYKWANKKVEILLCNLVLCLSRKKCNDEDHIQNVQ